MGTLANYYLNIASNVWSPLSADKVDVRIPAHWCSTWMGRALPRFPRYAERYPDEEPADEAHAGAE